MHVIRAAAVFLCLVACSGEIFAAKSSEGAARPKVSTPTQALTAKSSESYRNLRYRFAATKGYNAYTLAVLQEGLLSQHQHRAKDRQASMSEINEPLSQLVELYPVGITVNRVIANFLEYAAKLPSTDPTEDADDAQRSELLSIATEKRAKAQGLMQSILSSGDGRSPETAYQVINVIEEYEVLAELDLKRKTQTVLEVGARNYDVLVCRSKARRKLTLYFDITRFYKKQPEPQSDTLPANESII